MKINYIVVVMDVLRKLHTEQAENMIYILQYTNWKCVIRQAGSATADISGGEKAES